MQIKRKGTQAASKGPTDRFTGTARIDPLFEATENTQASGASVTFEPGARTAWHSHPLGQILIVTAGSGLVQSWRARVEKIQAGDVVWTPPSEKHWHGAAPTMAMTHISILEQAEGQTTQWMEHVSEEQYLAT